MTVGELNRALDPFFKVVEQAARARAHLRTAQEVEEGEPGALVQQRKLWSELETPAHSGQHPIPVALPI